MGNVAMVNPASGIDAARVEARADREGLEDHVLFATSGSSGEPKWAALSRAALERSAEAVNEVLQASSEDVWLRALPEFHVAGFAIGVRGALCGASVRDLEGRWEPQRFVRAAEGATLCSLVPTQVHDLVAAQLAPPGRMRAVLVGGSRLPDHLRSEAESLGWPIMATYGMTEAGSSVAIDVPDRDLRLLPVWRARCNAGGEIEIAGEALFTKYLGAPPVGEWFATGDRGVVDGEVLQIAGRCDSVVKVLGEQVDLLALEERLPDGFAVVALPDDRAGSRLLLVATQAWRDVLEDFNRSAAGYERLSEAVCIDEIPRGALGKVRREELVDQVLEKISDA